MLYVGAIVVLNGKKASLSMKGKVLLEVERLTVPCGGACIRGGSIDTGITVNSPEPHDECCLYCACQTLK